MVAHCRNTRSLPCTPWSKRISWLLKVVVMVSSSSFSYFALNNKIKWIIMNLSPKAFSQTLIYNKIFKVQMRKKQTTWRNLTAKVKTKECIRISSVIPFARFNKSILRYDTKIIKLYQNVPRKIYSWHHSQWIIAKV